MMPVARVATPKKAPSITDSTSSAYCTACRTRMSLNGPSSICMPSHQ